MTLLPQPSIWTEGYTATWDAWNRLIELKAGSTQVAKNTYDALTRRITKTTPAETRDYYFDRQWRTLQENFNGGGSGTVRAQYVWSPLDRWTLIRRQRSVSLPLDETKFVLKDYLDPAAIVAPDGTVNERFSYDAFGPVRFMDVSYTPRSGNTSAYAWTFLFHAEFIDSESGLYNYGYRFYHPQLGRWLSRDPIAEVISRRNSIMPATDKDLEVEQLINIKSSGKENNAEIYLFNENNSTGKFDFLGLAPYSKCVVRSQDLVAWRWETIGGAVVAVATVRRCVFQCYCPENKNCSRRPCMNPFCKLDHGVIHAPVRVGIKPGKPGARCADYLKEAKSWGNCGLEPGAVES
jgi:RHS repeat-associated protein